MSAWKSLCLFAVAACAPAGVRESATRTLSLFEKTAAEWKVPCASCHHQSLAMFALDSARRHAIAVDEAAAQAHVAKTLKPFLTSIEGVLAAPIDPFAIGSGMVAAHTAGIRPSLATAVLAHRFLNWQLPDGHWAANDGRPPLSASEFTATAYSLRAIALYAPRQLAADRDRAFDRARRWLLSADARSTEDRAFRLLGLLWAGAPLNQRREAAKALLAAQRDDGGWSQEAGMASDAYATGEALYALRHSRALAGSNTTFRRGVRYLLDTQRPDGSWLVRTRLHSPAQISPPFFDSGFPNGRDQFISFAASAWAVLGLLESLPEAARPIRPDPPAGAEPQDLKPWMETALFGSVAELENLLAEGADANELLRFAVPDAQKVALLLKRGAKPDPRALSAAASYRGSAPVLRLLLDGGAKPGPDLLDLAAQTGDAAVVSTLLDHGAAAAAAPLLSAVQMNHFEVVRLLARRGADLNTAGQDGLTPLMSAAIQHRTEMVRLLIELGADPNVVNKFGYTALRHTSDISYADPETERVLKPVTRATQPPDGADR